MLLDTFEHHSLAGDLQTKCLHPLRNTSAFQDPTDQNMSKRHLKVCKSILQYQHRKINAQIKTRGWLCCAGSVNAPWYVWLESEGMALHGATHILYHFPFQLPRIPAVAVQQ